MAQPEALQSAAMPHDRRCTWDVWVQSTVEELVTLGVGPARKPVIAQDISAPEPQLKEWVLVWREISRKTVGDIFYESTGQRPEIEEVEFLCNQNDTRHQIDSDYDIDDDESEDTVAT